MNQTLSDCSFEELYAEIRRRTVVAVVGVVMKEEHVSPGEEDSHVYLHALPGEEMKLLGFSTLVHLDTAASVKHALGNPLKQGRVFE